MAQTTDIRQTDAAAQTQSVDATPCVPDKGTHIRQIAAITKIQRMNVVEDTVTFADASIIMHVQRQTNNPWPHTMAQTFEGIRVFAILFVDHVVCEKFKG